MKYYVTADVHGFFDKFEKALRKTVFFEDKEPHKLIICGDLFDRGGEALRLQEFILDLLSRDEVILIRGNHEELALDLLNNWHRGSYLQHHHNSNGTVDTICQLTASDYSELYTNSERVGDEFLHSPYIQKIIPATVDYFETENYIFTHGWIPCALNFSENLKKEYVPIKNWRNADEDAWKDARWINGMKAAHCGVIEKGKTIVCGHWHCSFGHAHYEKNGTEFSDQADYSPYYGEGIIALDACTVVSGKVNCIVIEDLEISVK